MSTNPDEGAWERVNRIFGGADTIEALTRLYREGGLTWEEARAKAIDTWNHRDEPE